MGDGLFFSSLIPKTSKMCKIKSVYFTDKATEPQKGLALNTRPQSKGGEAMVLRSELHLFSFTTLGVTLKESPAVQVGESATSPREPANQLRTTMQLGVTLMGSMYSAGRWKPEARGALGAGGWACHHPGSQADCAKVGRGCHAGKQRQEQARP